MKSFVQKTRLVCKSAVFLLVVVFVEMTMIHSGVIAAMITHNYDLNGTLADSLGGPSLSQTGGTLGSDRYTFGAYDGLSLYGGLADTTAYSIEMVIEYDEMKSIRKNDFKKIIDFSGRTLDAGLYLYGYSLVFYSNGAIAAAGSAEVQINTDFHMVLTRETGGQTTGYLNGEEQWSFVSADSNPENNILHFFLDDAHTNYEEVAPGSVDFIRIYDGALTAGEVSALNNGGTMNPVPEPATMLLFGIGLLGLSGVSRKTK